MQTMRIQNIPHLLAVIFLIVLSAYTGEANSKEVHFLETGNDLFEFSGMAYLINEVELAKGGDLGSGLEKLEDALKGKTGEQLDNALRMLNEFSFKGPSQENFSQSIKSHKTAVLEASLEWEANLQKSRESIRTRIVNLENSYNTTSKKITDYDNFVKKERDALDSVDGEIKNARARMEIILKESMAYLNKAIVSEEIPMEKIRLRRPATWSMRLLFQSIRGSSFALQGSKRMKNFKKWTKKGTIKPHRDSIVTVDGKEYFVGNPPKFVPTPMRDNSSHFDKLLKPYIEFHTLKLRVSKTDSRMKTENDLYLKAEKARNAWKKRDQIARNKYDITRVNRLRPSLKTYEKNIKKFRAQISQLENIRKEQDFISRSTRKSMRELNIAFDGFSSSLVADYFGALSSKVNVRPGSKFNAKTKIVAIIVAGISREPNLLTGKFIDKKVIKFYFISASDHKKNEPIMISILSFVEGLNPLEKALTIKRLNNMHIKSKGRLTSNGR